MRAAEEAPLRVGHRMVILAAILLSVWILHRAGVVDAELATPRKRTGISVFVFAVPERPGILLALIIPIYMTASACSHLHPWLHLLGTLTLRVRALLLVSLCGVFGFSESIRFLTRAHHVVAVEIDRLPAYGVGEKLPDDVQRHAAWGWYALLKSPGAKASQSTLHRTVQKLLGNASSLDSAGSMFPVRIRMAKEGFAFFDNLYFGGQFDLDGGPAVEQPSPLILAFSSDATEQIASKLKRELRSVWGPEFWKHTVGSKEVLWKVEHLDLKEAKNLKQAVQKVRVLPGLSMVLSDYMHFMAHYFHFIEAILGSWALYQQHASGEEVKWILFPNSQSCIDYSQGIVSYGFQPDIRTEGYTCQASWRGKGHVNEQILSAVFPHARVISEAELVHLSSLSLL